MGKRSVSTHSIYLHYACQDHDKKGLVYVWLILGPYLSEPIALTVALSLSLIVCRVPVYEYGWQRGPINKTNRPFLALPGCMLLLSVKKSDKGVWGGEREKGRGEGWPCMRLSPKKVFRHAWYFFVFSFFTCGQCHYLWTSETPISSPSLIFASVGLGTRHFFCSLSYRWLGIRGKVKRNSIFHSLTLNAIGAWEESTLSGVLNIRLLTSFPLLLFWYPPANTSCVQNTKKKESDA